MDTLRVRFSFCPLDAGDAGGLVHHAPARPRIERVDVRQVRGVCRLFYCVSRHHSYDSKHDKTTTKSDNDNDTCDNDSECDTSDSKQTETTTKDDTTRRQQEDDSDSDNDDSDTERSCRLV